MFGITANYIGAMCRDYRKYILHKTQDEIAKEIGFSRAAVSRFEGGTMPNAIIFMWYIKHDIFDWLPIDAWQGWGGNHAKL